MNFESLLVIYSSNKFSVTTTSYIIICAVLGAFIALLKDTNFVSFVNQSVIINMLLYSLLLVKSLDFGSFTIKFIITNFYSLYSCGINYIYL
jgi:RsiW-degrading membrane proteinase PrsW (M82 family)